METRIVQPMGQLTSDLPYSGSTCFGYTFCWLAQTVRSEAMEVNIWWLQLNLIGTKRRGEDAQQLNYCKTSNCLCN
jgi:hypothetical protein